MKSKKKSIITLTLLIVSILTGSFLTAAIPVPTSLTDPTARVWMRMEYPAEIRPIIYEAFWDQYPGKRPAGATGTTQEKLDLTHDMIKTYVGDIAVAHLKKHGSIEEGDTVAEKEALLQQKINTLMLEIHQNTVVTSGP